VIYKFIIIDINKIFSVRQSIQLDDSVEVIKGVKSFTGVLSSYQVRLVKIMPKNITNVSEYYRYEEICILRNGKKWIIDRDRYVLANEHERVLFLNLFLNIKKIFYPARLRRYSTLSKKQQKRNILQHFEVFYV
jgi:hypothetical protein